MLQARGVRPRCRHRLAAEGSHRLPPPAVPPVAAAAAAAAAPRQAQAPQPPSARPSQQSSCRALPGGAAAFTQEQQLHQQQQAEAEAAAQGGWHEQQPQQGRPQALPLERPLQAQPPFPQQQQQQAGWNSVSSQQQQWSSSSSNSASRSLDGGQAQALDSVLSLAGAAGVTRSIMGADSIASLGGLVALHGARLNHIHVSAAFIQLTRLWPRPGSSSSSGRSSSSSSSSSDAAAQPAQQQAAAAAGWLNSSSSSAGNDTSSSDAAEELAAARQLLLVLQGLAGRLGRVDGRYVSNTLYSLAALAGEGGGGRVAYEPQLVDRLCAAAFSLANSMPPQELATVCWALAKLGVLPAPALTRRLASNVLRRLPGFGPQDLLMALTGLPQLHARAGTVAPYASVHRLAAAAGGVLGDASPHEAAALLAALGSLKWSAPPAWLRCYWDAVTPKLCDMGWQQLAMLGWGLGQLAPLSEQPPLAWQQAWQAALAQQLQPAAAVAAGSSSSSAPLVEVAMVAYGWSKALPQSPPQQQLLDALLQATQAAMEATTTTASSLSLQQQQQQLQRLAIQQQQQHWRQPLQQQGAAAVPQLPHQEHVQLPPSSSSSNGNGSAQGLVSARLLAELLSAVARWQMLPPRPWLLALLSQLQQQLAAGACGSWELSHAAWSLASLGVRPNTAWLDLAADAAQQQLQQDARRAAQLQQQQERWRQQQLRQQQQQQLEQQQQQGMQLDGMPLSLREPLQQWKPQQQSRAPSAADGRSWQPRHLALLLWSFSRLQYSPGGAFWDAVWCASEALLQSRSCRLADLVMLAEAVLSHKQAPPAAWVRAALAASLAVHQRQQQLPRSGGPSKQQQGTGGGAASLQQREEAQTWADGRRQQQQQQFKAHVLRLVSALARLTCSSSSSRPAAGHAWCAKLLQRCVEPLAGLLTTQDVCLLLWSLGKLGFQPSGRALPPWLSQTLGSALEQCSPEQLLMLLSGLQRSKVVLPDALMRQLLLLSQRQAGSWPLVVQAHVLSYAASADIQPPRDWAAAMTTAVAGALHAQQQQQQPSAPHSSAWLGVLLSSLARLRLHVEPPLLQQLQDAAAALQLQQTGKAAAANKKLLQLLAKRHQRRHDRHEQPHHQQQQQAAQPASLAGERAVGAAAQWQQQEQHGENAHSLQPTQLGSYAASDAVRGVAWCAGTSEQVRCSP